METIVPIVKTGQPRSFWARGTPADIIAASLSAAAALTAFLYAAFFFMGFLENDTHLWGVTSAFLLCFGVGAFAYVPAIITARIAWGAHKNGAAKTDLTKAIWLLIPWVILALILTFVSDMPKIYSVSILITVLLLTAWALISLRKF